MIRMPHLFRLLALAALVVATSAGARGLGVDVWTDRGDDAVYQPGEALQVKARTTDDAYLLIYAISTEGDVRLLWPASNGRGLAEGRRTYRVPSESSDYDLVADDQTGQGYVVAIASASPFRALPWYLRPFDVRGEELGYDRYGDDDEEEGVTREGRIVGDPFVAMERIRERVLADPKDDRSYATSYAGYYVHELVRYPRYVCYDCHRPGRWAWWDGFDPYYARCSVFDFRVNWDWYWGPGCFGNHVPYMIYVVRSDCPPHYRDWGHGRHFSSWDGWGRWNNMWGSRLQRYKTPPPQGYVPPPPKGQVWRAGDPTPPGVIRRTSQTGGPSGIRQQLPIGRRVGVGREDGGSGGPREGVGRRDGTGRPTAPGGDGNVRPRQGQGDRQPAPRQGQGERQPSPRQEQPRYDPPRRDDSGERQPSPRQEQPRYDPPRRDDSGDRQPAPRQEQPRQEQPRQEQPRQEQPRHDPPRQEQPKQDSPRQEQPKSDGGGGRVKGGGRF